MKDEQHPVNSPDHSYCSFSSTWLPQKTSSPQVCMQKGSVSNLSTDGPSDSDSAWLVS